MRRWVQGLGLSLAAHGLLVLAARELPPAPSRSSTPHSAAGVSVTFRIEDTPPAPTPRTPPEATARGEVSPRVRRPRRARTSRPEDTTPPAPTLPEGQVEAPDLRDAESDAPASPPPVLTPAPPQVAQPSDVAAGDPRTSEAAPGTPGGRILDLNVRPPPAPPPDGAGLADLGPAPVGPRAKEEALPKGPGRFLNRRIDATIRADGTMSLEADGRFALRGGERGPSLAFDPTEELIRLLGDDPVAYDKSKFEKATRALRNELRDEACRADLQRALLEVKPRLARIWSDPRRTSEERRRAIFQVWNECAEDGPPEVVAAALLIRELVLDFIARNMPPGTAYAYTDEEVQRLNASRLGRETFEPYRPRRP